MSQSDVNKLHCALPLDYGIKFETSTHRNCIGVNLLSEITLCRFPVLLSLDLAI